MEQAVLKNLFDGARLLCYQTKRFKSTRITIRFALNLQHERVSALAAVPGLLRYTSRRYPGMVETERKLASLYGAGFSAVASKAGDAQILNFTISSIADKFAFKEECVSEACLRFLLACIFEPDLDENGYFKEENIAREKRLMIDDIKAAQSDKMAYSFNRFNELFYAGEPAAITATGTREQVECLDAKAVTAAWHLMLETAQIFVCAVGDLDAERVANSIYAAFKTVKRNVQTVQILPHQPRADVVQKQEIQPLEQCKLNIGFSHNCTDESTLKVMNMVFGKSEMSRLSKVVREKMSLCYYCASTVGIKKKVLIVYSGIESNNREKVIQAVCEQLTALQNGAFDEEEIAVAKRKLRDAFLSGLDTPADIDRWYLTQMFDEKILSVQESIALMQSVSKQQIMECAQSVKLDCVYTLGDEEKA